MKSLRKGNRGSIGGSIVVPKVGEVPGSESLGGGVTTTA